MHLFLSSALTDETKLFRYISFRHFVDFVETGQTSLSRIKNWPDTWEVPTAKLPIQMDDGPVGFPFWNVCESMFGQCWSLHEESDAMWRIYSPHADGIVIQSSVRRFHLLHDIKCAALGPVIYYDDLKTELDKINSRPYRGEYERFTEAFLKRKAFEHEKEVRFVTLDDPQCITKKLQDGTPRFNVDLDPLEFIEGIKLDPRADDRHLEVLQKYCGRAGFMIKSTKSTLYGDPYKHTRLVRKYVTVKKNGEDKSR
jgi:hypothetical protein